MCSLVALHSQNWCLVCEIPLGLSVQSSHLFLHELPTKSPYPGHAVLDRVFPLLFLLLRLSLWKLSSSFCYFSCWGFRFLFLGKQWSAVMALNVHTSWYKHWHKGRECQYVNNTLCWKWSFSSCSISFYMVTLLSWYFCFISYRMETRSREFNNKVLELVFTNVVRK